MSATVRAGAAGTCCSGGAGSGGSANPNDGDNTGTGGANGGAGGFDVNNSVYPSQSAAGAGNPNGDDDKTEPSENSNGTGGTLIVIVEGNISVSDGYAVYFVSNGTRGRFMDQPIRGYIPPFGGGSGGGIVIVASQNGSSFGANIASLGGTSSDGPSGGNGGTIALDLSAI